MTLPLALVVEDDESLSDIFAETLKLADYDVEVALDGDAAMEKLAARPPDLVLLDLHLPGVMGDDILAHIRSEARLADTQVVVASADGRMAGDLEDEGIFVLLKPISVAQLRTLATRLRSKQT